MRKRDGEYPFCRFGRRLLNVLWSRRGHARINRDDLLTLTDSGDPHQLVEYRRLLVEACLLEPFPGSNCAGTVASLYRMTVESRLSLTRPATSIRACTVPYDRSSWAWWIDVARWRTVDAFPPCPPLRLFRYRSNPARTGAVGR